MNKAIPKEIKEQILARVRKEKEKENLVSQFFKIQSTNKLFAGLAEQYGIVAEVSQIK